MRLALVFVPAFIGCYSPAEPGTCAVSCLNTGDCPGSLVCTTTKACGTSVDDCPDVPPGDDAGLDAPPDAPSSLVRCSPSAVTPANFTALPLNGTSFSAAFTGQAVYDKGGTLSETSTDGMMSIAMQFDGAHLTLSHPMLAPSGDEVFAIGFDNTTRRLQRTVRNVTTGRWTVPVDVTTAAITFDGATRFGQPTATNPRRICFETNLGLKELEEVASDMWVLTINHDVGATFVDSSPSLSTDGLTLVFVGHEGGGQPAIYRATRNSLTEGFSNASIYINDPAGNTNETDVSISPDCSATFVSANDEVLRAH